MKKNQYNTWRFG